MDSSDSVDWNKMLAYIQYLVENFYDVVNSNIGFGMITYGDEAKVAMPLNSKDTRRDVLSFIGQIQQQGGSSAGFAPAMQLLSSFFSPQQGGRIGVRQVKIETSIARYLDTVSIYIQHVVTTNNIMGSYTEGELVFSLTFMQTSLTFLLSSEFPYVFFSLIGYISLFLCTVCLEM